MQSRKGERGFPDRHEPLVHHDHQGVRQRADEGQVHARVGAVRPQAPEQHHERGGQQRQSERLDDRNALAEERLCPEPDDDRGDDHGDQAQADKGQVGQPAAGQQAEDQAENDAADQHSRLSLSAGGASTSAIIAVRGRARQSMSVLPGSVMPGDALLDTGGPSDGEKASGLLGPNDGGGRG